MRAWNATPNDKPTDERTKGEIPKERKSKTETEKETETRENGGGENGRKSSIDIIALHHS